MSGDNQGTSSILFGGSRLKLAVFGVNCAHGVTPTHAGGTIRATWPEQLGIARAADHAGLDAIIPVARWRGLGGDTRFNERSFAPMPWAAAVAAVTSRIAVFATIQIPTMHPVQVAKEVSTVDHVSGGRFALNVVASWNADELSMFGLDLREHDERYVYADEWVSFLKSIWSSSEEFDVGGRYLPARGVVSEPKPLQHPHPPLMSAGSSPAGRRFAAKHADIAFVNAPDIASLGSLATETRRLAREEYDRDLQVYGMSVITCRDTESEARRAFEEYVDHKGDWKVGGTTKASVRELIVGYGAEPLVGTPEQVVSGMRRMSEVGLDGITVAWVDYREGIEQYQECLRPLLIEAGLRTT